MVDADVVVDKLRYINQYADDLTQMRGMSKEEALLKPSIGDRFQQTC